MAQEIKGSRPGLTLRETVDLPLRIFIWVPFQLTINLIRTVLISIWRRLPLVYFIRCAEIRMFLYSFSPGQIQLFIPPSIDTYKSWIRKTRARARKAGDFDLVEQLQEDIAVMPDGESHILWVGNRQKATKVVYFFHGGGFITPLIAGHLEWCLQAYVLAWPANEVAVAVLQYTLCPRSKFPKQLIQASAGLAYLLRSGVRPSGLVIGGDSAGGNMTMQLLSHILHPHPKAEKIVVNEPLAGAFLVSPLVSGRRGFKSYQDNKRHDMLSEGIFDNPNRELFHEESWTHIIRFLYPKLGLKLTETQDFKEGRNWALPGDADRSWLEGLGRVVKKMYVTAGGQELLRDQGTLIADMILTANPEIEVKLDVAEKEGHDFILLEGERKVFGDATSRMKTWYKSVFAKAY